MKSSKKNASTGVGKIYKLFYQGNDVQHSGQVTAVVMMIIMFILPAFLLYLPFA